MDRQDGLLFRTDEVWELGIADLFRADDEWEFNRTFRDLRIANPMEMFLQAEETVTEAPACGLFRIHGGARCYPGYADFGTPDFIHDLPGVDDIATAAVPPQLRCPICTEVFQQAVVLYCCGHTFCESCIATHLQSSNSTCPMCRAIILHRPPPPNLVVRELVGSILVRCDNGVSYNVSTGKYESHEGKELCLEVFPLERRALHLAVCDHALHYCEYRDDGCNEIMLRKDVDHHHDVCIWRSDWCSCNQRVRISDISRHMQVCPNREISCRNSKYGCEARFPRRDEDSHLLYSCRIEAARPLLEANEKENAELKRQVEEMKSALESMKRTAAENDQSWKELRRAIDTMVRTLAEKDEALSESRRGIVSMKRVVGDMMKSMERTLAETDQTLKKGRLVAGDTSMLENMIRAMAAKRDREECERAREWGWRQWALWGLVLCGLWGFGFWMKSGAWAWWTGLSLLWMGLAGESRDFEAIAKHLSKSAATGSRTNSECAEERKTL